MAKTIILIAIVAVVGIGAYYFIITHNGSRGIPVYAPATLNNANTNASMPMAQPAAVPTPAAPVVNVPHAPTLLSVTIDIKNFSFNPTARTIKAGTTVTWVNNDAVSHTVTSDAGNLLDSPILSPGQSFSFTFTHADSTNYHCNIHPSMKGSVIVTN